MKLRFVLAVLFALISAHVHADDGDDCANASGDAAIAACTRAIESGRWQGANLSWAYNSRGIAWNGKGDYDRAIADYNEAIRLDPKVAAYNNRGIVWGRKGDYDRAIADYNEAIRLDPKYATAYINRGIAQFNLGEFSSAAADLAQAQQLEPDAYHAIWLYLARMRSGSNGSNGSNGKDELILNTNSMDDKKWPAPVVALYLGKTDANRVIAQAADPDPKKHKDQLCEANYYVGQWQLLKGARAKALTSLRAARDQCRKDFLEYAGAVSELKRLKAR